MARHQKGEKHLSSHSCSRSPAERAPPHQGRKGEAESNWGSSFKRWVNLCITVPPPFLPPRGPPPPHLYLKSCLNIYAAKYLGRSGSSRLALRTLALFYQINAWLFLWVSPLMGRVARFNKEKDRIPSYFWISTSKYSYRTGMLLLNSAVLFVIYLYCKIACCLSEI